jgi:hypothetical protein
MNGWSQEGQRVAIWGAAAKGVIFANMMEESAGLFAAIDINPSKQGHFLPGSGLPVISPEKARRENIDVVIIMNPNYLDEIKFICSSIGFTPYIISF